jgi:hypothetical protein
MQEFFERKKEAQKQEEKKLHAHKPLTLSMSEGPMLSEGSKIEAAGRASFEKSVKIELASLLMRKKRKEQKGKGKDKKGKDGKDDFRGK